MVRRVWRRFRGMRIRATVALASLLAAPGLAQRLSPPIHSGSFREALADGADVPRFSGGLLLSRKGLMDSWDPEDNLILYRRDGTVAARVRVWFPDSSRVWLKDATTSPESDWIAAVGTAQSVRGEFAGFLALISSAGAVTKLVRTAPFEGQAVGVGADRSIWVFGYQTAEDRSLRRAPDHMVLHQYSAGGKLLKQLLPRSSFACGYWHPAVTRDGSPRVLCSGGRILILSPACWEWIELAPDGELVGRYRLDALPLPEGTGFAKPDGIKLLTGAAMTSGGDVYASVSYDGRNHLFLLPRERGAWVPVQIPRHGSGAPAPFTSLRGSDGDALVYASTDKRLVWSPVVP